MIFKTQWELLKYIIDNNLETYWSDINFWKVYVRNTYTKSSKKVLTFNYDTWTQ